MIVDSAYLSVTVPAAHRPPPVPPLLVGGDGAEVGIVGEEPVHAGAQEGVDLADEVADGVGIGAAAEVDRAGTGSLGGTSSRAPPAAPVGVTDHADVGSPSVPAGVRGIITSLHTPIPSA